MILPLLVLALQSAPAPPAPATDAVVALPGSRTFGPIDEARFDQCHDAAITDPASGVAAANQWLTEGGSYLARQCLGFAYARQGTYPAAVTAFVAAAEEATSARDRRAAILWAQAGNAALAGGDATTARAHLNAAIVAGTLTGVQLGEAYLDRARAALALGDMAGGRADLDLAATHAAQDPLVWLLSATLARRQDDLARALADIAVAAQLGPRDAAIALEAGNIAAAGDRLAVARRNWETAVTLGGSDPAASTARARLEELNAFEAEAAAAASAPAVPGVPILSNPYDTPEVPAPPAPPAPTPQAR
jgi:tetratricopeptide (TPR) repeat protein